MNITKQDAENHRIALTFLGEKMVIVAWDEREYDMGAYPLICHPLYYGSWTVDVERYAPDGTWQYSEHGKIDAHRLMGLFDIDKSIKRLANIPPHVLGYYSNGAELWFVDQEHLQLFQEKYPTIRIYTP